ncbi:MFS transporter [Paenibacillus sediminis]|uniref:MFS family permease n=1 Tax=Paenibacillus sediminis TaxID=664909 RepID=A0ABS4H3F0_9BACL|nr:MFS transporter [Paenibacillus sediminis]MBP1937048.1 MFS family permease [Paenibacillus sediminis]
MKQLFVNRNFVRLFIASFTSQLGTIVGNMAFAFFLLDRFASQPYYATLAEMMYALPTLLVFFLVGVFADRFNRQRIAENSDWIRAGLSVLLVVAVMYAWLPAAFCILFLRSAVSKFFSPAEMAILQGVLSREQYDQAAGLNQMIFGIFMLFGVALGAIAYNTVGITGAVIIDGLSFVVSGLLIRSCRIDTTVVLPNGPSNLRQLGISEIFQDFGEGYRYIRGHRLLFTLLTGFFLFGFINGGFAVLPMFTMKYKLAPDHFEQSASLFAIFIGIGFLVGSGLGAVLVKVMKKHVIIIVGVLLSGLLTIGLIYANEVWMYLTYIGVIGCVLAPVNIAIGGWLPELVAPDKMGRVSAWIDPLMMLAQSIALGLIAILYPHFISLELTYWLMGGLLLLASIIYLWKLPNLVKEKELNEAISTISV